MDINQINQVAHGRWPEIVKSLTGYQATKRGAACPICGGNDRFSYNDYQGQGVYYCRGCGPGNSFKLIQHLNNQSFPEVLKAVAGYLDLHDRPIKKRVIEKGKLEPVIPCPKKLDTELLNHALYTSTGKGPQAQTYTHIWEWKYSDDNVIGYIGRKQDKTTHQIYWTEKGWTQGSIGTKDRPLFGLQSIKDTKQPIYVVEGEKTWQAVIDAGLQAVTWVGGAATVKNSDYSVLEDTIVYLCPDNDEPGRKAMEYIASVLKDKAELFWFDSSNEVSGWDLADYDNSVNDMEKHIEALSKSLVEQQEETRSSLKDWIKPLGFNHGKIYVMPGKQLQIRELNISDLGSGVLRGLAPVSLWEQYFPKVTTSTTETIDWLRAGDWLVRECENKVYTPENIRGRGVWKDKNDIVFHKGDSLLVNGAEKTLLEYKSDYVYARAPLIKIDKVAFNEEEKRLLIDICKSIRWQFNSSALLLLGWLHNAQICGFLPWRPHVWIIGEAGVGKSTLLNKLIKPALGSGCLYVEGDTTEAGIRQLLQSDALAVLFDEPETDEVSDKARIQKIIKCARVCSTDNDAIVAKGTSGHTGISFAMRAMFCFASINVGIKHRADRDRISILELQNKSNDSSKHWESLEKKLLELPRDFHSKFFNYALERAEETIANMKIISNEFAKHPDFKSQRIGDQYGALLAGAWSIMEDKRITPETAAKLINSLAWGALTSQQEETSQSDALHILIQSLIDVPRKEGGIVRLSVGELVRASNGLLADFNKSFVDKPEACSALERHGILVRTDDYVFVSNKNENLRKMFLSHPFLSDNWKNILLRLSGATEGRCFINGIYTRGICIPIGLFIPEKNPF